MINISVAMSKHVSTDVASGVEAMVVSVVLVPLSVEEAGATIRSRIFARSKSWINWKRMDFFWDVEVVRE